MASVQNAGRANAVIQLFGHLYAPDDRGLCAITVDDGMVAAIRPAETPPAGSLGGSGTRILPGLIDMQINGDFGFDFSDPSADIG